MCGIIAIAAERNVASDIISGLKHLEYRGYDSAGIATISGGNINSLRAEGKLFNLGNELDKHGLAGKVGIGHTRWATHGVPSIENAHPHATDIVAVVHNGIIENFRELRHEMQAKGYAFKSQTDTEIVPVMLTYYLNQGATPHEALLATIERLHGAYALAVLFVDAPDKIYAARLGPPLAVGYGDGENYIGSDAVALSEFTERVSYLEDGDIAEISADKVEIYDKSGKKAEREITKPVFGNISIERGQYRHFMQKEIFEQPQVVAESLRQYCDANALSARLPEFSFDLDKIKKIQIIACGTSYYAGQVAKYWLEEIARIPTEVDIASEYRYRNPIITPDSMTLLISQSGETADTLAVLRHAKEKSPILAIVNAPNSSIAREAQGVLYSFAGPEIGVASTKAFTTQLATLACFTLALAERRGAISPDKRKELCSVLLTLPSLISQILLLDNKIEALASGLCNARDMLYIGRGTSYAIAMEGALKMKEISYIHAEAYAAGELKHGPIALIDDKVPVVVIAPSDSLFEKTSSNLQEVAARGGRIILISDSQGVEKIGKLATASITLPAAHNLITPILYSIPAQLLAYHTAILKGTDVDQPRNLAKSVTVE